MNIDLKNQSIDVFDSTINGLSSEQAKEIRKKYGLNELPEKDKKTALTIFINQFKGYLAFILIIAAIISFWISDKIEAILILTILFANALLGFFQEYKAEKAIQLLKKYLMSKTEVLRDGEFISINSKEIVPGDIVHLSIGDIVPADIRILKSKNLSADEAMLTGESVPVEKKEFAVTKKDGKAHLLFMGTTITSGNCYGLVVFTGKNTEFGKIAKHAETPEISDFQKNIKVFGNFIIKIILVMSVFVFIVNILLGKGFEDSLLFALALSVGITPELLPIIITSTLSQVAVNMARKKVIVRKLTSVEDLGGMNLLCCDKTGTLTEGKISLKEVLNLNGELDNNLIKYAMLNELGGQKKELKNPIDKAIWDCAKSKDLILELDNYELIDKNDFDFKRRRMSYIVSFENKKKLFVKGAPDSILSISTTAIIDNKEIKITEDIRLKIQEKIDYYESEGYRPIALGFKNINKDKISLEDEKEVAFLGFLILLDQPKSTAKDSIKKIQELGIEIKILTGDSPLIAKKVCEIVGFKINDSRIITGKELENLSESERQKHYLKYNVFARVDPEQKSEIIKFLRNEDYRVGYIGDGVNDVPALKESAVGISVDTGADIAKDASDIILLQKSLHVLIDGIIEGRKSFINTIKYILNTISANFGNMFTVSISSLFLPFIPLLPLQILLTNIFTDIPLMAIATDNVDSELLKKPQIWDINFISNFMLYYGITSSFFDLVLISTMLYLGFAKELFRTIWFIQSTLSELLITFSVRTRNVFYKSLPSKLLIVLSLISGLVVIALPYSLFGRLFELQPLSSNNLLLIFIILISYFVAIEILKKIKPIYEN